MDAGPPAAHIGEPCEPAQHVVPGGPLCPLHRAVERVSLSRHGVDGVDMKFSDLLKKASEAGVTAHIPVWMGRPDECARDILDSARHTAKILKKHTKNRTHSECLDIVARACGQKDWHQLHTVTTNIIESSDSRTYSDDEANEEAEEKRSSLGSLAPCFSMIAAPSVGSPPDSGSEKGIRAFALSLSSALGVGVEESLDIQAKRFGSASWDMLMQRRPEDCEGPLYRFHGVSGFECGSALAADARHRSAISDCDVDTKASVA